MPVAGEADVPESGCIYCMLGRSALGAKVAEWASKVALCLPEGAATERALDTLSHMGLTECSCVASSMTSATAVIGGDWTLFCSCSQAQIVLLPKPANFSNL
jgi:hypothetical protein